MSRILLVEDSEDSYNLIRRALDSSIEIIWANDYFSAMTLLETEEFDLVLLDVVLPDGSGLDLATTISANPKFKFTPLIFITCKNQVSDIVIGFSTGADDYITKPFDLIELRARVNSKLRKNRNLKLSSNLRKIGPLKINLSNHVVELRNKDGYQKIELTPIEYKILTYLMSTPGRVFSRDEILNQIWGQNIHVYPRSVDTHVSKLRRKLGDFFVLD